MSCRDFGFFFFKQFTAVVLLVVLYLRPAAPVDVHTDGTVGAAAAHEEMSPVVRLHHPDEVTTAVLEKQTEEDETTT